MFYCAFLQIKINPFALILIKFELPSAPIPRVPVRSDADRFHSIAGNQGRRFAETRVRESIHLRGYPRHNVPLSDEEMDSWPVMSPCPRSPRRALRGFGGKNRSPAHSAEQPATQSILCVREGWQ